MSSTPETQLGFFIPDVIFHADGVSVSRELSGEELNQLLTFVVKSHDASNWWAGDTLAYIHKSRGEDAAREAARQFRDPMEIWDAMRVCQALDGQRVERISFRHHRTALDECRGDAKAAMRWILRAMEENWKISDLRSKIRRAMSTVEPSHESKPSKICFTSEIRHFIDVIRDVTTQRPINSWTFEECEAFLQDTRKILAAIEDVQERYQTFTLL